MDQIKKDQTKKDVRTNTIIKALEDGWTVKKSSTNSNTFEFTKGNGTESETNCHNSRRSISAPIVKKF